MIKMIIAKQEGEGKKKRKKSDFSVGTTAIIARREERSDDDSEENSARRQEYKFLVSRIICGSVERRGKDGLDGESSSVSTAYNDGCTTIIKKRDRASL